MSSRATRGHLKLIPCHFLRKSSFLNCSAFSTLSRLPSRLPRFPQCQSVSRIRASPAPKLQLHQDISHKKCSRTPTDFSRRNIIRCIYREPIPLPLHSWPKQGLQSLLRFPRRYRRGRSQPLESPASGNHSSRSHLGKKTLPEPW
jgi:hypothetical protein